MNKADLISALASSTGLEKKAVDAVVDGLFSLLTEMMKKGEKVSIVGFGEFTGRMRKGRIGVNPQNPSIKIDIPSVLVPKFKAGSNLKNSLKNQGKA